MGKRVIERASVRMSVRLAGVAHECVSTTNTHLLSSKLKNHEIIKQHEFTISFDCKRQRFAAARPFLKHVDIALNESFLILHVKWFARDV